jgi:NitT/TauT family transport system ATP-binding protein
MRARADGQTPSAAVNNVSRPAPATSQIRVEDLEISYALTRPGERYTAVRGISFTVEPGELVCIAGPSGCGKSTILNAVAGLVPCSSGSISIGGSVISGPGKNRGVVFQKAALLPWRTVQENVMFGLRVYGVDRKSARARAAEMLELVGLTQFAERYPYQLSGGMQQRVNLARALAADPEIVLLDEPFAALDALQREILQGELLQIWESARKTGIFITHQIDEAVLLGDRVIVMSKGPAAGVKLDLPIDLPRPRGRATHRDSRFAPYVEQIWESLHGEADTLAGYRTTEAQ